MHLLCVIPARIGSSRLREKPLCLLAGEPLIRVVARRVLALGLEAPVVVATDDARVVAAVAPLGVEAVLTRPEHRCGTERVAEVASMPRFADAAVVLNVQGDEPLLPDAAALGALARVAGGDAVGTAAVPLPPDGLTDPHQVKVVVDRAGRAQQFSRTVPAAEGEVDVLGHVGVYAYTGAALQRWARLAPTAAELASGLEQLRPLANGMTIGVARIRATVAPGIDTAEDLARVEAHFG